MIDKDITDIFQISMFPYFRLVLLIQYFLFIISVIILQHLCVCVCIFLYIHIHMEVITMVTYPFGLNLKQEFYL